MQTETSLSSNVSSTLDERAGRYHLIYFTTVNGKFGVHSSRYVKPQFDTLEQAIAARDKMLRTNAPIPRQPNISDLLTYCPVSRRFVVLVDSFRVDYFDSLEAAEQEARKILEEKSNDASTQEAA